MSDWITTGEAAKRAQVSINTIKKWCNDQRIKHRRLSTMTHVDPVDLDRFLKAAEVPASVGKE